MESGTNRAVEHHIAIAWSAAGLRCDPEEAVVNSRRGDRVVWELESDRRGARIRKLVFADGHGPFQEMRSEGKKRWIGAGSRGGAYGRFKYSIWVEDEEGHVVELDPYILDTDRP